MGKPHYPPGPPTAKLPKLTNGFAAHNGHGDTNSSSSSTSSDSNSSDFSDTDDSSHETNGSGSHIPPPPTILRESGRVADWDEYLRLPQCLNRIENVAGVNLFKNAPLADIWEQLTTPNELTLTVEVTNIYVQPLYSQPVRWFATILGFAGYKCLLEYDNLDHKDERFIVWASFCSNVIRPLGYSNKNRDVLLPPFDIGDVPDFYEIGLERNLGNPTVAENHGAIMDEEIKRKQIYSLGTMVEVVDMMTFKLYQMKLATVEGIIGDRICVKYIDAESTFNFNVKSEFVHPLGWSQTVGHDIDGIPSHMQFTKVEDSYFPRYPENVTVEPGQFLEFRHPVQTHQIVAAKVSKVLNHGYFYAVTDSLQEGGEEPWMVAFHITSPYILPCGFCKRHGIELIPPSGENIKTFSWDTYFSRYNAKAAPLHLLPQRPKPRFELGMKMEAIDETDPRYLWPVTIVNIKEHLLWLHFDGWTTGRDEGGEEIFAEKWIDFESPNIYPVGFSEMIMHSLQGRPDRKPPTHPSIKYNALAESLTSLPNGY